MTKPFVVALLLFAPACADDGLGGVEGDPNEQITRVALTFTPEGGGAPVMAAFSDPDGDGGMSGSSEPVILVPNTSYALAIAFANELVDPPEDITEEVEAECEDHLVLVYGDAVAGPATGRTDGLLVHAYADVESDYAGNAVGDDLPVGLASTIATSAAGMGQLSVMLRHLPVLNGTAQKEAGLPERYAAGEQLPGDVDADVDFAVTVQ